MAEYRNGAWKNWLLGVLSVAAGIFLVAIFKQVIVNTDRISKLEAKMDHVEKFLEHRKTQVPPMDYYPMNLILTAAFVMMIRYFDAEGAEKWETLVFGYDTVEQCIEHSDEVNARPDPPGMKTTTECIDQKDLTQYVGKKGQRL